MSERMNKERAREISKETLQKLYIDENKSRKEIGEMFGVGYRTIEYYLAKHKIKKQRNKAINKKDLEKMYVQEEKSTREIAKILGVSQPTVLDHLKKNNIKTRNYRVGSGKGSKRIDQNGYVIVYYPTYHKTDSRGYVKEHRLVMEQYLGRTLADNEEVHHINHDRVDNRIENLQLMTKSEHGRLHAQEQWANRKPLPQPYERKE